jgi:hypothetical protein
MYLIGCCEAYLGCDELIWACDITDEGHDCSLTRYQSMILYRSSPGAVGFEPVTICITALLATTGRIPTLM